MNKQETLQKALDITKGAREEDYGSAKDNFERANILVNAYLFARLIGTSNIAHSLTREEQTIIMMLHKIARLIQSPQHEDSWVDLAGYAACGAEIATADDTGAWLEVGSLED